MQVDAATPLEVRWIGSLLLASIWANPMTSNRNRPKLAVHETHLVCQLRAENASGRVEDDQGLDYSN